MQNKNLKSYVRPMKHMYRSYTRQATDTHLAVCRGINRRRDVSFTKSPINLSAFRL